MLAQAEGGPAEGTAATSAFIDACKNGDLAIAQCLYGGGGVDAHADDDYAFAIACDKGHLAVAVWLHDVVGGVDAHAAYVQSLRWSAMRSQWIAMVVLHVHYR